MAKRKPKNCGNSFEEDWRGGDRAFADVCLSVSVFRLCIRLLLPAAMQLTLDYACIYSVAIHCSNVSTNLSRYFKCVHLPLPQFFKSFSLQQTSVQQVANAAAVIHSMVCFRVHQFRFHSHSVHLPGYFDDKTV